MEEIYSAAGGAGGVAAGALPVPVPAPRIAEPAVEEQEVRRPRRWYLGFKRICDLVVAAGALLVFGMFVPLLALIIKLDSPGPVFYSQERVGYNRRRRIRGRGTAERRNVLHPGRPFRVHKLRTMRTDAEVSGPQWAKKNDSRVTRVGRFLRKTRIDEIPQFFNIIKGEMSLIGPRPERLVFVHKLEQEIPNYRDRLLVSPGITGLAQVLNGYDDSIESVRRKVALDRTYIRRAGLRQDGRILFSTVGVVLKGEGAH